MRLVVTALVLAAALLAGCRASADAEERLTRDEFLARADAVCAEYERRIDRLGQPGTLAELARIAEEAEAIAAEGVDKLRALEPPEELEERVEEWLVLTEQNVEAIGDMREAAEDGDETRVQELASASLDREEQADRLAARIGLEDCAAGPTDR